MLLFLRACLCDVFRTYKKIIPFSIAGFVCCSFANAQANGAVKVWLTTADRSALFQLQQQTLPFTKNAGSNVVIKVDDKEKFQGIDGFGFALTQGSAMPIIRMSKSARAMLLKNLFDTTGNAIGISYIRLTIGSSDLNEKVFSYDDVAGDTSLAHFDLGPDHADVIPVMKEILSINPKIKILGSPWSPPAWMKTNSDTRGGRLQERYYGVYARYFVKYIQQMKAQGIRIDAITVQNEPLHPGNNPSLLLTAPEEAEFIKHHLGPAFKKAGITTKILIYDHNADRPDYPIYILDDKQANAYVDGSAFHLYGGEVQALSDVHDAHPDKNIYFTEQMVVQFEKPGDVNYPGLKVAEPVSWLFIGVLRNWSRNVLEWNLAANSQFTPYTDRGGCDVCQGAVSVDGDTITNNLAYYAMAHFSKLVRPGAVRIASGEVDNLPNVAFKTTDGSKVLVVANTGNQTKNFSIQFAGKSAEASLQAGSVATYYWK